MILRLKKIIQHPVVKNFSYVTIGSIAAQLLNLVAIVKISKLYGTEAYGLYTFINVQSMLIFTIADLGLRNIIIRTIARDKFRTNDVVVNGLIIRLASVLIFSLIYYGYNAQFGHLTTTNVALISAFAFAYCVMNLFESTFWGHEQMLTPAILNVSTSVLWLGIILFGTSKINFSVNQLFSIFISIQVLTALCYFIVLYSKKVFKGQVSPFFSSSKELIRQSWPYFVLVVLNLPYNYLTNNFLDFNSTKTEIGFFNLTQKMMSPISLVITFSLSALFPNLSKLWISDQEKFKKIISQTTRIFFLIALMLCFLYTTFAENIVRLFFSPKYYAVIKISQMQVWFVFFMGVNSLIGTIWGATNNEKMLVKSSIINVVIALPILYLSSRYGALGLSYGYVLSFAIFEIYLWNDFKKSINIKIENDFWIWLAFAFAFVLSYFVFNFLTVIFKIIIGLILISSIILFCIKYINNRAKVRNEALTS